MLVRRGSEARRRALRRSEAYFPYFAMRIRYDDESARAALAPRGIEAPSLRSYFDRLMEFARTAEWGRRQIPRHQAIGSSLPGESPAPHSIAA